MKNQIKTIEPVKYKLLNIQKGNLILHTEIRIIVNQDLNHSVLVLETGFQTRYKADSEI